MQYTQSVTLDLSGQGEQLTVSAKQGDCNSRLVICSFQDHAEEFTIPSGTTARVFFQKPDLNQVFKDVDIIGNTVQFFLDDQMLYVPGKATCEVALFDSKTQSVLSSAVFFVLIFPVSYSQDKAENSSEYQSFQKALINADVAIYNCNNSIDMATAAAQNADYAAQKALEICTKLGEQAVLGTDNTNEKSALAKSGAALVQPAANNADALVDEFSDYNILQMESRLDEINTNYVSQSRTINGLSLADNIALSYSNVSAAPTNHASSSTTYGVASKSSYGHVKYGTTNDTACVGNDTRLIPVGTVLDYVSTSVPTGYLLCRGQAISRTTYSALYSAIGTIYGSGDGTTTFNLPNNSGEVLVENDSNQSSFNVMDKAGDTSSSADNTDHKHQKSYGTITNTDAASDHYMVGEGNTTKSMNRNNGVTVSATHPFITAQKIIKY